jgi:hypothetical protein
MQRVHMTFARVLPICLEHMEHMEQGLINKEKTCSGYPEQQMKAWNRRCN